MRVSAADGVAVVSIVVDFAACTLVVHVLARRRDVDVSVDPPARDARHARAHVVFDAAVAGGDGVRPQAIRAAAAQRARELEHQGDEAGGRPEEEGAGARDEAGAVGVGAGVGV